MPFNGSGTFQRVRNWMQDAAANIRIRADRHDSEDDNFAQGLSQCITKDGQTTITANLPMANYRHTNVGAATAINQYVRYDQLQLGKAVWAEAGGTADAITAIYTPSTFTPVDGQLYYVRASAANATTTPTFSPDGTTAQIITKYGSVPLGIGDIFGDGHDLILRYRSSDTKYELLNPAIRNSAPGWFSISGTSTEGAYIDMYEDTDNGKNKVKFKAPDLLAADVTVTLPAASGTLLLESQVPVIRNFIDGYIMSTAGASTTITVSAGQATDSANAAYLSLAASLAKTTAAWVVGAGGGLDTGSIAPSTWYHFYVIRRPDTGVVDVLFSTNGVTPTLPANYTQFRRIGSGVTNSSSQWVKIGQNGDTFTVEEVIPLSVDSTNPGATSITSSVFTPLGVVTTAILNAHIQNSSSSDSLLITSLDQPDSAASTSAWPLCQLSTGGANTPQAGQIEVKTNTSSTIRWKARNGTATTNVRIATVGWIDRRGKQ